jgi:hypothetical protein
MRTLRRAYRRRFGYHVRFNFAVVLTILVVAWVAVPSVARFIDAWARYAPLQYEPKDLERQAWMERHAVDSVLGRTEWNDIIGIGLFLLVAVVWMTLMTERASRRRPPR